MTQALRQSARLGDEMANTDMVTCKPETDGHKRNIAVTAKDHADAMNFVKDLGFEPAESRFVCCGDQERN